MSIQGARPSVIGSLFTNMSSQKSSSTHGGSGGTFEGGKTNSDSYSSGSNNSSTSGVNSYSSTSTTALKTYEERKEDISGQLETKKSQLSSLQNSDAIAQQQGSVDTAKAAYDEACNQSNFAVKMIKQQLDANDAELQIDEENIQNAMKTVADLKENKNAIKGRIASMNGQLAGLNNQLNALNSTEVTDENKDAIESQKRQIQQQINKIKHQLDGAKQELNDVDAQISEQNTILAKNIANKAKHEARKNFLEKTMEMVADDQVFETLQKYQEEVKKLNELTAKAMKDQVLLMKEIDGLEKQLAEVDAKIAELKAQEAEKEEEPKETEEDKKAKEKEELKKIGVNVDDDGKKSVNVQGWDDNEGPTKDMNPNNCIERIAANYKPKDMSLDEAIEILIKLNPDIYDSNRGTAGGSSKADTVLYNNDKINLPDEWFETKEDESEKEKKKDENLKSI